MNDNNKTKPNKLKLTNRGKIAVAIASAALVGTGVTVGGVTSINWDKGHTYTTDELDSFPQESITVPAGTGANEIVRSVEASLGDDAQGFIDVRDYVSNQGLLDQQGNPMLRAGQQVLVPLVPGIAHTIQK